MKILKAATYITLIVLSTKATAQKKADISGTWTLKGKTGVSGPQYVNALPESQIIRLTKDSLITDGIFEGTKVGANYALNGSVSISKSAKNETITRQIKWSNDGQLVTLITAISYPGDAKKVYLTRYKTLKIEDGVLKVGLKSDEADPANQSWETQATYVRQ